MSICSKMLDPLFIELRETAIARDQYEKNSDEYIALDKKCVDIFAKITTIFNHYNPNFKANEAREEKERRGMGYK